MRKHGHGFDEAPRGGASSATLADLEAAIADLAEAERRRAAAAVRLARIRARGDGEAAAGMPVEQHLRWRTNLRRGTVSTLGVLGDVAPQMPHLLSTLEAGAITFDQAAAVAWPAAKATAADRVALDGALELDGDGWTRLEPESLEVEVLRLLDELADPVKLEERDQRRREAEYLHVEPTLLGDGVRGGFQMFGVDAVLFTETLFAASAAPVADDTPDPAGVIVQPNERQRRGQLDGLLRILREWGGGERAQNETTAPPITILAIVDERDHAPSQGAELLASRRGLAPRLTPSDVADLRDAGARTVTVYADANGDLIAIAGRHGHLHDDPAGLSEDASRLLCLARDLTCRMPGCSNPVLTADLHHLLWKSWGKKPDRSDIPDDPSNRALLCRRCHHRVVHRWRWTGTVGIGGSITWRRLPPDDQRTDRRSAEGPAPPASVVTIGRLRRRLRPPPHDQRSEPTAELDPDGDPLPF